MEWQPIETYPIPALTGEQIMVKGPRVLLFSFNRHRNGQDGIVIGYGNKNRNIATCFQNLDAEGSTIYFDVTHWMPLPEPPYSLRNLF